MGALPLLRLFFRETALINRELARLDATLLDI